MITPPLWIYCAAQVLFDVEEGGVQRLGSIVQKIWAINTKLEGDLAILFFNLNTEWQIWHLKQT